MTDPIKVPQGFVILRIDERYEAGQATFEEVKDDINDRLARPMMEPKIREYLTQLRQQAFLEIKEGYVDSGAAPGKDTRWQRRGPAEAADHHQGRSRFSRRPAQEAVLYPDSIHFG